jgi:hypothetical protein
MFIILERCKMESRAVGTLSKYSSVAQVEIIVICILSFLVRLSSLRSKKVLRASCQVDKSMIADINQLSHMENVIAA